MGIPKRQTIRIGSKLDDLLATGTCAGSSLPKRLDILATRFQFMMASTKPPSWPAENWKAFFTIAKDVDLSQIGAIYSIQGNAKALSESRLAFALENMTPPQQVLLLQIFEQYTQLHGDPDVEKIEQFLESQGYTVVPAVKV